MTLPRTITTLLLSFVCLASACGGNETDVSDEPVDVTDPVEQTDEALRSPPGGTGGFNSCSAPPVTCRNAKGQITGQADGCSTLCFNQMARCLPGTCEGRIIVNATCGCFGL